MHLFTKNHSIIFSLLLIVSGLLLIHWRSGKVSCKELRNGVFHFYGKQSKDYYIILRQDSLQREVNVATNDTSFWKVDWVDDCIFSLKYSSGGRNRSEEEKKFLLNHITVIQIQKITADYYVVKGSLDSLNSRFNLIDTVWMQPK